MRLLTFQAARFAWKSGSIGLPDLADPPANDDVCDAIVLFIDSEPRDVAPEAGERALRHVLKHVKWIANKRSLRNVVLHSFAHLGGDHAPAVFARSWLAELATRLSSARFDVRRTPFGWSCSWELAVFGEGLAKVWKEIGAADDSPEPPPA